MNSRHIRRAATAAGSTIAAVILLSGCGIAGNVFSADAQRDESGSVTEDSNIDIFDLKVGDCKLADDANSEELSATKVVPCADSHDEEIFHEFELPEGEYPGEEAIYTAALEGCEPEFASFVGISEEESSLTYAYFSPTPQGWSEVDDRTIQCVLFTEDGTQLEGSAEGTKI